MCLRVLSFDARFLLQIFHYFVPDDWLEELEDPWELDDEPEPDELDEFEELDPEDELELLEPYFSGLFEGDWDLDLDLRR